MKKYIALMLVVLLALSMFGTASAEDVVPYSSNYFHSYGTVMSKAGGGAILITFTTTAMGFCDQLGVASYTVEKETDEGWVNVSGLLVGQCGSNVVDYSFARYFQGVKGETYRVNVTFIAVMGGGMESKVFTGGPITAD